MIRNYFKIALRNLAKNKTYVLINTLGMGIAMACCLTAYLLLAYNIEFDNYFRDDEVKSVVKVMAHLVQPNGREFKELAVPIVMAPIATQEITGIEKFTRYCNQDGSLSYQDKAFYEDIRFADAAFFEMFKLNLKSGSYKNFENQRSVFLSEELSRKYFAGEDPVGQIMAVEFRNKKYDVVVGGVLTKIPLNCSFNISALMRIETYLDAHEIEPASWGNADATLLLKLTDMDQRKTISEQLKRYTALRNATREESKLTSFELLPFRESVTKDQVNQTNLRLPVPFVALLTFGTMGCIILLIACFNLTNTTVAITAKRIKEIGVRKVIGSSRGQIVGQFMLEMVIILLLAIVAGLLMGQLIVPKFTEMWQLQYGLEDLNSTNLVIGLLLFILISAILAGLYPALSSSKFKPVDLLKGALKIKGTSPLTRVLLVTQFSLSVIVLIAGIVFSQNENYQQTVSFGYDKEKLLTVSIGNEQEYLQLKNALNNNPRIEAVTGAANHVSPYGSLYRTVKIDTSSFKTRVYEVGDRYFDVLGMSLVAGRDFNDNNEMDYESSAIVDENFVKEHNLTNPIETSITYQETKYRVIGVVKNHLNGLKEKLNRDHFYTMVKPEHYHTLVIRAGANSMLETKAEVEAQWKSLFPGKPFQINLQDDLIYEEANGYNTNLRQIFIFLTILGSLLSASGIYSLASLNVQRRTKEIGVRKVLGASVASIMRLINQEFAIILTLAMIAGGAGGYFLTDALMDSLYVQHIAVNVIPVVLCGMLIFAVGILATSGTIFRAAQANPTESLKSE